MNALCIIEKPSLDVIRLQYTFTTFLLEQSSLSWSQSHFLKRFNTGEGALIFNWTTLCYYRILIIVIKIIIVMSCSVYWLIAPVVDVMYWIYYIASRCLFGFRYVLTLLTGIWLTQIIHGGNRLYRHVHTSHVIVVIIKLTWPKWSPYTMRKCFSPFIFFSDMPMFDVLTSGSTLLYWYQALSDLFIRMLVYCLLALI